MSGFIGLWSFSIISDQVCYIYEEIGLHMANLLISNGTWSDHSHWVTPLISDKKFSLSNLQNVI